MWWQYIIVAAVLSLLTYSFVVMVGYRTRLLTRKTDRTAQSMYDDYASLNRKQRKSAEAAGGQRHDDREAGRVASKRR
jgi:hypothetical protein